MKGMTDGLWTVWTTRKRTRLDHTAHSPGDDGVGHFSIVKRVLFQLSRFRRNCSSGSFFDCQMGTLSLDKNSIQHVDHRIPARMLRIVAFRQTDVYLVPVRYVVRLQLKGTYLGDGCFCRQNRELQSGWFGSGVRN